MLISTADLPLIDDLSCSSASSFTQRYRSHSHYSIAAGATDTYKFVNQQNFSVPAALPPLHHAGSQTLHPVGLSPTAKTAADDGANMAAAIEGLTDMKLQMERMKVNGYVT
jgi:hypothetical protein